MTNQKNILILVALVAVIGGGYLLVHRTAVTPIASNSAIATTSPATTTSVSIAGGTLGITGTGGYTVKVISGVKAPKAPDYNAPLTFPATANLSAEQKTALQAQAATLRAQLSKNPSNYTSWLALGRTFKMAGDYAQAAKIWTYVSLMWPADAVVFGNLGDLYMNFIKDYPKADASYRSAIQNDQRQTNAYRNLFSLYSGLYTTHASAAEDILKKGIQNNPEALDFYVLLARYYRDAGRIAEAKAEYNMAIIIAKGQTNAGAAGILSDIMAEQSALK